MKVEKILVTYWIWETGSFIINRKPKEVYFIEIFRTKRSHDIELT